MSSVQEVERIAEWQIMTARHNAFAADSTNYCEALGTELMFLLDHWLTARHVRVFAKTPKIVILLWQGNNQGLWIEPLKHHAGGWSDNSLVMWDVGGHQKI